MIKEIKLKNIEIEDFEKSLVVRGAGKLLKIHLVSKDVKVKILTREGELIFDNDQSGVYYPRANISARGTITLESDKLDYYYFMKGLLIIFEKNTLMLKKVEKLSIIYENA